MQNVTNICSSMMQLHQAYSSMQLELYGLMELTKPFTLRLYMEIKCGHVVCEPKKKVILLRVQMNHLLKQYRIVLPLYTLSYALRKALCVILLTYSMLLCICTQKTSVTPSSHGVMPSNSRSALLRQCQKEDSPRLDLI